MWYVLFFELQAWPNVHTYLVCTTWRQTDRPDCNTLIKKFQPVAMAANEWITIIVPANNPKNAMLFN